MHTHYTSTVSFQEDDEDTVLKTYSRSRVFSIQHVTHLDFAAEMNSGSTAYLLTSSVFDDTKDEPANPSGFCSVDL